MPLETEIRAYDSRIDELRLHHNRKWVVFHEEEFVGAFDTLDNAAEEAFRRFGYGPYLIRQVGEPANVLPPILLHSI